MMNLSVKFRAKDLNLGRNLKNLNFFYIFVKFFEFFTLKFFESPVGVHYLGL